MVPVVLGTLVLTSSQGLGNMTSRTLVMKLHTETTVLVSEEVIGEDEDRRGICGQKESLEQAAGWGRTDCALPLMARDLLLWPQHRGYLSSFLPARLAHAHFSVPLHRQAFSSHPRVLISCCTHNK